MGFFSEHLCNHWSEDDEDIISELRREKEKYYQQTLDDEIQINELLQTLQEIKTIAEKEIYMKQNSSINKILDLITKAEEE